MDVDENLIKRKYTLLSHLSIGWRARLTPVYLPLYVQHAILLFYTVHKSYFSIIFFFSFEAFLHITLYISIKVSTKIRYRNFVISF